MAKLDVSRMQISRPQWHYSPYLRFWWRIGQCAYQDAMKVDAHGRPADDAVLARDWFARSSPVPLRNGKREFVSFEEVCHWLGLDCAAERVAILEVIDRAAEFDSDEAFERLERLSETNPNEDDVRFEVPEMFRVVPVRDQGNLFLQQ